MKVLKLITALTIIKHNDFFDSIVQSDLHVDNCNFSNEEALKLGVWVQDIHIFSLSIESPLTVTVSVDTNLLHLVVCFTYRNEEK